MIKWHDLTKHPDDLPEMFNPDGTGKAIAVIFVNANGEEIGHLASYRKIEDDWVYYRSSISINERVIRWAYLDGDGEGVADVPKPSPKNGIVELRKRLSANAFSIESRLDSTFERLKVREPSFPLGETTLAVKCAMAEMDSNIESAFADYERGEKCD